MTTVDVLKILGVTFIGTAIASSHTCSIILNVVFIFCGLMGLKKAGWF